VSRPCPGSVPGVPRRFSLKRWRLGRCPGCPGSFREDLWVLRGKGFRGGLMARRHLQSRRRGGPVTIPCGRGRQSRPAKSIEPGSPLENGYAESFHSQLRDECLALEVFDGLRASAAIEAAWRATATTGGLTAHSITRPRPGSPPRVRLPPRPRPRLKPHTRLSASVRPNPETSSRLV